MKAKHLILAVLAGLMSAVSTQAVPLSLQEAVQVSLSNNPQVAIADIQAAGARKKMKEVRAGRNLTATLDLSYIHLPNPPELDMSSLSTGLNTITAYNDSTVRSYYSAGVDSQITQGVSSAVAQSYYDAALAPQVNAGNITEAQAQQMASEYATAYLATDAGQTRIKNTYIYQSVYQQALAGGMSAAAASQAATSYVSAVPAAGLDSESEKQKTLLHDMTTLGCITKTSTSSLCNTTASQIDPLLDKLTIPPIKSQLAKEDSNRMTLSLTQPLFTGGRVKFGLSQVRNGAEALDQMAVAKRRETALSVASAYFNTVLARRAAKVNDQAFDAIKWHVDQAQALFDKGMIPKYDLMRAQTELANQDQKRLDSYNQAELALAFLLDTMGTPQADVTELTTPLDSIPAFQIDFDKALTAAFDASPEMKALQAKDRMYRASVKSALAERNPVAALVYTKELYDEDLALTQPAEYYGIVLKVPAFDGGKARSKASQARSQIDENLALMKRLENGIRLETRKYFLDLTSGRKSYETAQQAVNLAEESLRLAKHRYEVGQGTSIEVTDAILALSIAQTNLDKAYCQYDIAYFGLKKVMGDITTEFTTSGGTRK